MSDTIHHGGVSEAIVPEWLILRYDLPRNNWTEIGCTRAWDAGAAFRDVVLKPNQTFPPERMGEYRVLPLDGAGHFAVELNMRDLDAEKASKVRGASA